MTPDATRLVVAGAPPRAPQRSVLLCRPDGYRIAYAINPHMRDETGALRRVDGEWALRQWNALGDAYRSLGFRVDVIEGDPAFPDMVFAANPALPFVPAGGGKAVLLSNMRAPERRGEVDRFEAWFNSRGYEVRRLSREAAASFEGHGDLLWHPTRRVLFGGFGFRTAEGALSAVSGVLGIPVVPLRLVDPRFYHLDTCFMPLDAHRALLFRPALTDDALDVLRACFDEWIEPPESEAVRGLACNADCPDGRNVLIDASCSVTISRLEGCGFRVTPLDLSEFLKAGGSAFCMKLWLP
jgi:N-dimethylarginine dimethylaminohydrolase